MGDALGTLLRNALPRTPTKCWAFCGALAQLGERLICIQEVIGSIPIGSTIPPWNISSSSRVTV